MPELGSRDNSIGQRNNEPRNKARILLSYFYPGVQNIVLRLNRIHVIAVIKMTDCYHNNGRCVKRLGIVKNL